MGRIGRNKPCPCGSGKKYKKCCGDPLKDQQEAMVEPSTERISQMFRRHEAQELIRTQQQGLGKPIISTKFHDYRVVAVKDTIYYSKMWNFFSDFLGDYIQNILGQEWYSIELEKPLANRHTIIQWYHPYCEFLQSVKPAPDGTCSAAPTGVVTCYLGLAYGLYLLKHNIELQDRMVARLKDPKNFQGAYYEIIIANILIRAGFELELEDETDTSEKHCEFSTTSKKSGRKYWVEAKMRGVAGLMGKTEMDGGRPTAKPTSRLTEHLRQALRKPANDVRLIFIDVNAPDTSPKHEIASTGQLVPSWMQASMSQFEDREKYLKNGETAYVFVTNFPFHWHLDEEIPTHAALAQGLGFDDFGKPVESTLAEIWKNKQKHTDAYNILKAIKSYPSIPSTFDGDLPLTREKLQSRILIGNTYTFEIPGGSIVGSVTSAGVDTENKIMYFSISISDGGSRILTRKLSDDEFDAYKRHPEAYFGEIRKNKGNIEDPYELFEWLLDGYKDTPRERLLKMAHSHPDFDRLKELNDMDIRLALCEGWVASILSNAKM